MKPRAVHAIRLIPSHAASYSALLAGAMEVAVRLDLVNRGACPPDTNFTAQE
jgi:hypothetical protein